MGDERVVKYMQLLGRGKRNLREVSNIISHEHVEKLEVFQDKPEVPDGCCRGQEEPKGTVKLSIQLLKWRWQPRHLAKVAAVPRGRGGKIWICFGCGLLRRTGQADWTRYSIQNGQAQGGMAELKVGNFVLRREGDRQPLLEKKAGLWEQWKRLPKLW